jgi:quinol monooxygenase YgiN
MFNVIYRWKIHGGKEAQFEKAWAELTQFIRAKRGGMGSRLHRCSDGTFLAYAQWPDEQAWVRSSNVPLPDSQALAAFKASIESSEKPVSMMLLHDLFV